MKPHHVVPTGFRLRGEGATICRTFGPPFFRKSRVHLVRPGVILPSAAVGSVGQIQHTLAVRILGENWAAPPVAAREAAPRNTSFAGAISRCVKCLRFALEMLTLHLGEQKRPLAASISSQ